jgi:hypothetical protein
VIGLLSRLCGGSDDGTEFKCYEYGHDWRYGGTEWRLGGFDEDGHAKHMYRQDVRFVRRKQCHTCGLESADTLRAYVLPGESAPEDAPTLLEDFREAREEDGPATD